MSLQKNNLKNKYLNYAVNEKLTGAVDENPLFGSECTKENGKLNFKTLLKTDKPSLGQSHQDKKLSLIVVKCMGRLIKKRL